MSSPKESPPSPEAVISAVPIAAIPSVWGVCSVLLSKAVDRVPGCQGLESVLDDLVAGAKVLWVAIVDDVIVAACTTEVTDDSFARVMTVTHLGGFGERDWFVDGFEILSDYAESSGCDLIRCVGRRGWSRKTAALGFREVAVVMEKSLCPAAADPTPRR